MLVETTFLVLAGWVVLNLATGDSGGDATVEWMMELERRIRDIPGCHIGSYSDAEINEEDWPLIAVCHHANFTSRLWEMPRQASGLLRGLVLLDNSYRPDTEASSVICTETFGMDNVTLLIIQRSLLQDIPPDFIKCFQKLYKLDLSENRLESIHGLSRITSLKYLILCWNNLTEVNNSSFSNLRDLVELDLSHNRLLAMESCYCEGLISLQTLHLHHNNLSVSAFTCRIPLPRLHFLDLSHNPLGVIREADFQIVCHLHTLFLDSCGLVALEDGAMSCLTQLRLLSVRNNNLVAVPTTTLSTLGSLRHLSLAENRIKTLTSRSFEGLKELRILSLNSQLSLVSVRDYAFCGLRSLQELFMGHNSKLSYFAENAFRCHKKESYNTVNLSLVYLPDNALKTVPENLLPWDTIAQVDMAGNPWNCTCQMSWLYQLLREPEGQQEQQQQRQQQQQQQQQQDDGQLWLTSRMSCASPPKWKGSALTKLNMSCGTVTVNGREEAFTVVHLWVLLLLTPAVALVAVSLVCFAIRTKPRNPVKYSVLNKTAETQT